MQGSGQYLLLARLSTLSLIIIGISQAIIGMQSIGFHLCAGAVVNEQPVEMAFLNKIVLATRTCNGG